MPLTNWQWVPDLCAALTDGLPALTHLRFGVSLTGSETAPCSLTDECMGAAVLLRVMRATVPRLQSDQWANTPWPWQDVYLRHGLNVVDFARLPDPCRRAAHLSEAPYLSGKSIVVTDVVEQVRMLATCLT